MYVVLMIVIVFGGAGMATKKDSLKTYKEKRDFKKTNEPKGTIRKGKTKLPIFVIQRHEARALHYDLRLEIGGTLVSWAVPKGPSLNPAVKRLAIQTEDHPIEYAKFEGVIPEGQYGAGPVMIWDRGTFKNIKEKDGTLVPLKKCLKEGRIEIFLKGEKLHGAYALIRTKGDDSKQWLLIKMRDEFASAKKNPVNTQTKSVKTGRTMFQIKRALSPDPGCKGKK